MSRLVDGTRWRYVLGYLDSPGARSIVPHASVLVECVQPELFLIVKGERLISFRLMT